MIDFFPVFHQLVYPSLFEFFDFNAHNLVLYMYTESMFMNVKLRESHNT